MKGTNPPFRLENQVLCFMGFEVFCRENVSIIAAIVSILCMKGLGLWRYFFKKSKRIKWGQGARWKDFIIVNDEWSLPIGSSETIFIISLW